MPPQEGEPGRYDAFLSYAREDRAFAERLAEALAARGQRVWLDVRDIPGGAQWRLHQAHALEACKAFVFLLSLDSVGSQNCRGELEQAEALNKLVIPISYRAVDQRELPPGLADPEWIFLHEEDRLEDGVEKLTEALHVDHDWRQQHTRLAMRAREWEEAGEDKSFLLRGSDLANAESWLTEQAGHREAPTARQADFIVRSRQAARVRQRRITMAFGLAFLLAIGLAAFALDQRSTALDQKHAALSRALAIQAREVARTDIDTGALLAGGLPARADDRGSGRSALVRPRPAAHRACVRRQDPGRRRSGLRP
jgi:TIR domain